MIAVPAMQTKTIKLLSAHTNFVPIHLHIGSMKKELIPRTTYEAIKAASNDMTQISNWAGKKSKNPNLT